MLLDRACFPGQERRLDAPPRTQKPSTYVRPDSTLLEPILGRIPDDDALQECICWIEQCKQGGVVNRLSSERVNGAAVRLLDGLLMQRIEQHIRSTVQGDEPMIGAVASAWRKLVLDRARRTSVGGQPRNANLNVRPDVQRPGKPARFATQSVFDTGWILDVLDDLSTFLRHTDRHDDACAMEDLRVRLYPRLRSAKR